MFYGTAPEKFSPACIWMKPPHLISNGTHLAADPTEGYTMTMNVVFSSPSYQVLEYPEQDAFELVDKIRAIGTLIQGEMAAGFRASLLNLSTQETSEEDVDDLIGTYDALMHLPQLYH